MLNAFQELFSVYKLQHILTCWHGLLFCVLMQILSITKKQVLRIGERSFVGYTWKKVFSNLFSRVVVCLQSKYPPLGDFYVNSTLEKNCSCVLSSGEAVGQLPSDLTLSQCMNETYNGTAMGPGCPPEGAQGDVFFLSFIEFFGTFAIAYFLKGFRNTGYFPTKVSACWCSFGLFWFALYHLPTSVEVISVSFAVISLLEATLHRPHSAMCLQRGQIYSYGHWNGMDVRKSWDAVRSNVPTSMLYPIHVFLVGMCL